MTNTQEQVSRFITTLLDSYPHLKIEYDYDSEEDYYYIKHNRSDLQFQNNDFPQLVGQLIRSYFFNHDIYNISFGYDHQFFKTTKYRAQVHYNPINIKIGTPNFKEDLFYQKINISGNPLLINNKTSNITVSFDVTESLELYNRQAYSTDNYINFTFNNNPMELAS